MSHTPALASGLAHICCLKSQTGGGKFGSTLTAMKSSLLLAAFCLALAPFKLPAATTHYVDADGTNSVPPYTNWVTAATSIQAANDASTNGDTVLVTNGVYQTGGKGFQLTTFITSYMVFNRVAVTKAIAVRSVNGPAQTVIIGSLTDPLSFRYLVDAWAASVRCAFLTNGATLDGFTLTNGFSIDTGGGGVSCASTNSMVTNCIIAGNASIEEPPEVGSGPGGAFSGTLNNCVLIANHAIISGGGASASVLNNCLLTGNFAGGGGGGSGGGAYSCVLNNCTIVNNLASAGAGGVDSCMLNNCMVGDNTGVWGGGGAYSCVLNGCTIVSNFAYGSSGGVESCTLDNCIVYDNNREGSDNNYDTAYPSSFNYCCTMPMPTNGVGNITNDPAFVNLTNGDFHLQATSRCINAGNNSSVVGSTDLDGNPRIMGGTVDMGAYEFQAQVTGTFSNWLQKYNLPTDGTADCADSDGTGMVNWQKWIAGLNPTNPASVLVMTSAASTNKSSGITVSWQSVTNRIYYLRRANDLATQPAFSVIQSNIVGQAGTTSYTDASATNGVPYFYRVGVQ